MEMRGEVNDYQWPPSIRHLILWHEQKGDTGAKSRDKGATAKMVAQTGLRRL